MNNENLLASAPEDRLSAKHKLFCVEYLKDFNAAAAARRCGYHDISAANTGSRILKNPDARAYLQELQGKRNHNISLAGDAANSELVDLAFINRKDFFNENGHMKTIEEMPEHLLSLLQISASVSYVNGKIYSTTTCTLPPKTLLMEKLSKRSTKQVFKTADEEEQLTEENFARLDDGTIVRA